MELSLDFGRPSQPRQEQDSCRRARGDFLDREAEANDGTTRPAAGQQSHRSAIPGIEFPDLLTLQEIDDLDYIRRISNFE